MLLMRANHVHDMLLDTFLNSLAGAELRQDGFTVARWPPASCGTGRGRSWLPQWGATCGRFWQSMCTWRCTCL